MVLLGLVLALGLVVAAARLKINLGHALWAGSLVLGLSGAVPLNRLAGSMAQDLVEPQGLALMGVIVGLMTLTQLLQMNGQMDRLLGLVVARRGGARLSLVAFTALIGLLPMPGGAVFSAPMVESLSRPFGLSPRDKSLINYWFRHIWEFAWPLYPSLILIAALAQVNLLRLVTATAPLTLAAVGWGVLFLLRPIKLRKDPAPTAPQTGPSSPTAAGPILVAVGGALTGTYLLGPLGRTFPPLAGLSPMIPLLVALILAILFAVFSGGRPGLLLKAVGSRHTVKILYLILAILGFQGAARASGAIEALSRLLTDLNLPLPLLIGGLTFSLGLMTGYSIVYVAAAYPVFLGLLPAEGMMPYLILGHVTGFTGVLLSPAHACLLLSNQYFEAPTGQVYRRLLPPTLLTLACGLGFCALLAWAS